MSIIFLAGVHGVGKGYLGAPVAELLGIMHCTASQLIRNEKGCETWNRGKLVAEVDDNQRALVHAIHRLSESGQTILLDGHFVLRSEKDGLVRLAIDVFAGLRLSGAILLCDDSEIIADRLNLRDGVAISPQSIAALAVEEASHAHDVCRALGIALTVIESPTESLLKEAVVRLLGKQLFVGNALYNDC